MRQLTPREDEIMTLVKQGLTNKEIATKLELSDQTVKNHLSSVFKKLDVSNRITAIINLENPFIKKVAP